MTLTLILNTLVAPMEESVSKGISISASATKSVSETDRMRKGYRKILKNAINNPGYSPFYKRRDVICPLKEYTVYDMDKNGIPELILNFWGNTATQYVKIYSYNTKTHKVYLVKNVNKDGYLAIDSYTGDLITELCRMDFSNLTRIHLKNNKITVKRKSVQYLDVNRFIPKNEYLKNVRSFVNPLCIPLISWENGCKLCYGQKKITNNNEAAVNDPLLVQYAHKKDIKNYFYLINKCKITKNKTTKQKVKQVYPKQVTVSKSVKGNSATLKWKATKCSGYYIYKYSNKKWKLISKASKSKKSYTFNNLKKGTYKFKVVPFNKYGNKILKAKNCKAVNVKITTAKKSKTYSLYKKIPHKYTNMVGTGGWYNQFVLSSNGTFKGTEYISDVANNGKAGEINYVGKFSAPKKIDNHTYSATLVSFKVTGVKNVKNTGRVEGFNSKDVNKKFIFYLSGTKLDSLPSTANKTISLSKSIKSSVIPKGYCFIYNTNESDSYYVNTFRSYIKDY